VGSRSDGSPWFGAGSAPPVRSITPSLHLARP
jgi:hypothetical protein